MKKILIRTAAFLLVCISVLTMLASCTVEKAYPGAPDGMRPCNDGSNGVVMYVPANWSVDTSTGIPTAYFSYNDSTMINMVTVPRATLGDKKIPDYFNEYKTAFESSVHEFSFTKYSDTSDFAYYENISTGINLYEYRYSFKVPDSQNSFITYCFAQAYFTISETSDLYIITYSTTDDKFDIHLADLTMVYQNLEIVSAPIDMGEDSPQKPEFSNDSSVPGYSAITAEYIDYVLYVPSDWTPVLNTGMTAASKSTDKTVTANVTAFNPHNNDNVLDEQDYDSYFAAAEKLILDTFKNITFDDPNQKYVSVPSFADEADRKNAPAPRKYTYRVSCGGIEYTYEQYIVLYDGYFYVLTMSCKTAVYAENKAVFDGIAQNFKFKL